MPLVSTPENNKTNKQKKLGTQWCDALVPTPENKNIQLGGGVAKLLVYFGTACTILHSKNESRDTKCSSGPSIKLAARYSLWNLLAQLGTTNVAVCGVISTACR